MYTHTHKAKAKMQTQGVGVCFFVGETHFHAKTQK